MDLAGNCQKQNAQRDFVFYMSEKQVGNSWGEQGQRQQESNIYIMLFMRVPLMVMPSLLNPKLFLC